jgi:hypothetical protein
MILGALLLAACESRTGGGGMIDDGDMGDTTPVPTCKTGETRCMAGAYQTCQNGMFRTRQSCTSPQVCSDTLGCVDCDPKRQMTTCVGGDVHQCGQDGKAGAKVKSCATGMCTAGRCDCDPRAANLIYVVDSDYRLLSFDPRDNKNEFKVIGELKCPAAASWPQWGDPVATPFSMSIDRKPTAWVLYTSGEIFHVDTTNAMCKASTFQKGQAGFQLFGMGFVSDEPMGDSDTLFISGGAADDLVGGNLGKVDPTTLKVSSIGPLAMGIENSPELSGTGGAELYGYFPGTNRSMVARIDQKDGKHLKEWMLPGLGRRVTAWAFAHWGGRFYIFVSTDSGGMDVSTVKLFDPRDGSIKDLLTNTGYRVVGAGVSTCAPLMVPG